MKKTNRKNNLWTVSMIVILFTIASCYMIAFVGNYYRFNGIDRNPVLHLVTFVVVFIRLLLHMILTSKKTSKKSSMIDMNKSAVASEQV